MQNTLSPSLMDWMKQCQEHMEASLDLFLTVPEEKQPSLIQLHEAMRYAVLDGGKRVRPLLVFAAGRLFDSDLAELTRAACAVELIHAYSLVHDDMPCMDNDMLRRGKPTVHAKFGQAMALLVGDALQAQAFLILAQGKNEPTRQLEMLQTLAQCSGSMGMCGGQAIDLGSVGMQLNADQLEHMHRLKTGAILRASVLLGAYCGRALDQNELAALHRYANAIGLAFQVVDDILDATSDSTSLGKTAGKDAVDNKPTYVSLLGLEMSRVLAEKLRIEAHNALEAFNVAQDAGHTQRSLRLAQLADFIVQRSA